MENLKNLSTLTRFFRNYQNKYASDFQFVIVPEFHKDGAIHFHGCCKGFADGELICPEKVLKRVGDEVQLVPNTKGYLRWVRYDKNMGIFNCSRIKNYTATAFYITKYITKNMKQIPVGVHLYSCSRGLDRPQLVVDEDYLPMMASVCFENEFVRVGYTRYDEYGQIDQYGVPAWVLEAMQAPEVELQNEIVCFDYEQLKFA